MNPSGDFEPGYFSLLKAARNHWWVRGMQDIASSLTDDSARFETVLDAGCGTGAAQPWLRTKVVEGGCVHGIDAAWPALEASDGATEVHLVQGSVVFLPYTHSSFDMIVSADVLQHLSRSDAQCALAEMERVLRPGGLALIRTNAAWGHRWLPTREDWRLYTPEGLRAEVMSAGLTVERITYANAFPSLWAAIPRPFRRNVDNPVGSSYNSSRGVGIPGPSGPIRSALMSGALRLEAQWLQGSPHRVLAFGHTLFAVARKDVH